MVVLENVWDWLDFTEANTVVWTIMFESDWVRIGQTQLSDLTCTTMSDFDWIQLVVVVCHFNFQHSCVSGADYVLDYF